MEFNSIRPRQRVSNCCKKFAAFLFSQVGLATMVVAYSIMGGFLFRAIESPYEEDLKAEVRVYREQKVDEVWQVLTEQFSSATVWNNTQFVEEVMKIFVDFQGNVAKAVKEKGWDGSDESGEQWSFPGALLYAVTVITTIGYGHIAPKTNLGRFVTILYALVGIPLTFLYLSTIGNFLAHCFRIFYKRICCDICCCLKCERMKRRQLQMLRRRRQQLVELYSDGSETHLMALMNTPLADQMNKALSSSPVSNKPSAPSVSSPINTIANPYAGQTLSDGSFSKNGSGEQDVGGVRRGENWLSITVADSGSGSLSSAQEPRARTVDSGSKTRDTRVFLSSSSSSSQGDIKDKRDKKSKNRSRPVADAVPKTPATLRTKPTGAIQSTPTSTKGAISHFDRRFSLRETWSLRRGLIRFRLTSAFKRTRSAVNSERPTEGTSLKRKGLRRSQSAKEAVTRPRLARSPMSENGDDRQRGDRGGGAAGEGEQDREVSNGIETDDILEVGESNGRPIEVGKGGEAEKLGNVCKYRVTGRLVSASVERNTSFDSVLRKGLQEADLNDSEESFVTANDDSSLYEDIYRSTSVFDCSTSGGNIFCADPGRWRVSNKEEVALSAPKKDPASQCLTDCQRLTKSNVRIRFAESDYSTECRTDYADDGEDTKHSKIRVPIYVCLIVITSYILAGSVLFTLWEDWDLLTGSYFCFITLSTIGFGDIVPGTDMDKWNSSEKLVLCVLWLALGLSLLAMCFNLMQEEVKEKCKWVAIKCGLIRNETKL